MKKEKDEKWFGPQVETGWKKEQPSSLRRSKVLKAHKGNYLKSGQAMQALSNVSEDRTTSEMAGADAKYFYRIHREIPRRPTAIHRPPVRITPKQPKLRR